jgi:DNA repair protein RecO (recombination protein O)
MILRTYDFGESSMILVVLTREHGKMRMMAKGAKKQRSSFAGVLQTGKIGDIVFYHRQERGLQLLKEFSADETPGVVTEDFVKLCLFQAGLELIDASVVDRESDMDTFDILETFKTRLFASPAPWFIFFTLEVKMLRALGVLPPFEVCARCGSDLAGDGSVHPASGVVTCRRCTMEGSHPLTVSSRSHIRTMAREPFHCIPEEELEIGERKEIGHLLHHLFLHHVEGYRLPNALHLLKGGA